MPEPYVPPGARQATDQARLTRARYQQAVAAIRKDRSTSQAQKRRELDELRVQYTNRMAELRRQRNDAHEAAQAQAIRAIMRPPLDGRFIKDSYHQHRRALRDAGLATLQEEFDWAELAQDQVLMKVVAAIAFQRMTPLPGDAATRLVERYINQRRPDGSFLDADAAGGYERWLGLRRTPEEVMAETAIYSVSGKPEPTTEPGPPPDPRQQAADRIAELFPTGDSGEPSAAVE